MEYASGNIFIRTQGPMAKDIQSISHQHNFDHTTYVAKGGFSIEQVEPVAFDADKQPTEFRTVRKVEKSAADLKNWVLVKANTWHRLTALEDDSVYHCLYSHHTPQGDIVQEYDGWMESYN